MSKPSLNSPAPLRPSSWAMERWGYTPARRCAFWQFVRRNRIPFVRLGARRIMFNEAAVLAYEAKRASGRTS